MSGHVFINRNDVDVFSDFFYYDFFHLSNNSVDVVVL
jgi:hypothetical protein